jgi:hypothetical protein
MDIRQAFALQEYLRNMESIYKPNLSPTIEMPGTIRKAADTGQKGR